MRKKEEMYFEEKFTFPTFLCGRVNISQEMCNKQNSVGRVRKTGFGRIKSGKSRSEKNKSGKTRAGNARGRTSLGRKSSGRPGSGWKIRYGKTKFLKTRHNPINNFFS